MPCACKRLHANGILSVSTESGSCQTNGSSPKSNLTTQTAFLNTQKGGIFHHALLSIQKHDEMQLCRISQGSIWFQFALTFYFLDPLQDQGLCTNSHWDIGYGSLLRVWIFKFDIQLMQSSKVGMRSEEWILMTLFLDGQVYSHKLPNI